MKQTAHPSLVIERCFLTMVVHESPGLQIEEIGAIQQIEQWIRKCRSADQAKSLLAEIHSAIGRSDSQLLKASRADRTVAFACLAVLDWDSDFFDCKMGEIKCLILDEESEDILGVAQGLLLTLLHKAKEKDFAHLMCRLPADNFVSIWALERSGFNLMDIRVVLSLDLDGSRGEELAGATSVRLARDDDLKALQEIASDSFTTLRFAVDPFVSPLEREAFFSTWARNLYDDPHYTLFVAVREGGPVGFIASSIDRETAEGRIGLIAVQEEYRQMGLATALLGHALAWFNSQVERISVVTQAINYPALSAFQKIGFAITRTDVTFSVILSQERRPVA